MTKSYELPNGHRMIADFDENGICKVTVQALDSLVEKLNYYADKCEECDRDCEHCAYIECPKEPCEDAVSRQAVLDYLKNNVDDFPDYHEAIEKILDLPSVQPKAKTGRWSRKTKVDAYDIAGVKTWGIKCQCDKCDFTTIVVEDFGYYKYCPHCGAKAVKNETI